MDLAEQGERVLGPMSRVAQRVGAAQEARPCLKPKRGGRHAPAASSAVAYSVCRRACQEGLTESPRLAGLRYVALLRATAGDDTLRLMFQHASFASAMCNGAWTRRVGGIRSRFAGSRCVARLGSTLCIPT